MTLSEEGELGGERALSFLLDEQPAENLTRWRLRNRVHELDLTHFLVRGHAFRDEGHDLVGGEGRPYHDERLRDLPGIRIRNGNHGHVGDGGMPE